MNEETEVFTEEQVEIHYKTMSIFDRLHLVESIASDLVRNVDNEMLHPTNEAISATLHYIIATVKDCKNDFDSLDMADIADIEAARKL